MKRHKCGKLRILMDRLGHIRDILGATLKLAETTLNTGEYQPLTGCGSEGFFKFYLKSSFVVHFQHRRVKQ